MYPITHGQVTAASQHTKKHVHNTKCKYTFRIINVIVQSKLHSWWQANPGIVAKLTL